jgi:uncharacterized membrane protein
VTATSERPQSAERLVMFTDAVAAIALTLLILPLLEVISVARTEHLPFSELIDDHLGEFGAFVLSFAVIFRFWWSHHRLFGHIVLLHGSVVRWSFIWTFAIVLLPIPTSIITAYPPSPGTVGLYGGTLVLATGSLAMLAWSAYRHPEVSGEKPRTTREEVLGSTTILIAQVLATIVGCVFSERINFWAFTLMFLVGPVERRVKARWAPSRV